MVISIKVQVIFENNHVSLFYHVFDENVHNQIMNFDQLVMLVEQLNYNIDNMLVNC